MTKMIKNEEMLEEMSFEDLKKKLREEGLETSSAILAIKNLDGNYLCCSAFLEGEPEGLGVQLYTNYNDELKARQLVSMGDFYKLGSTMNPPKETIDENFYPESIDYTIFMDRDLGIQASNIITAIAGDDLFTHSIGCSPKIYDEIALLERANKLNWCWLPCYMYIYKADSVSEKPYWHCYYYDRFTDRDASIFTEEDVIKAKENEFILKDIALKQNNKPSNYEEKIINMIWKNINIEPKTCYLGSSMLSRMYTSDDIAYMKDDGNTIVVESHFSENEEKQKEKIKLASKNLLLRVDFVKASCNKFRFSDYSKKQDYYLLGKKYKLEIKENPEAGIYGIMHVTKDKFILEYKTKEMSDMDIYNCFKRFYIDFLEKYIKKRIKKLQKKLGVCSSDYDKIFVPFLLDKVSLGATEITQDFKLELYFFWRYACCSEYLIDEIILHELIHVKIEKKAVMKRKEHFKKVPYAWIERPSLHDTHNEEFYSYYSKLFPDFENKGKIKQDVYLINKQMYL